MDFRQNLRLFQKEPLGVGYRAHRAAVAVPRICVNGSVGDFWSPQYLTVGRDKGGSRRERRGTVWPNFALPLQVLFCTQFFKEFAPLRDGLPLDKVLDSPCWEDGYF